MERGARETETLVVQEWSEGFRNSVLRTRSLYKEEDSVYMYVHTYVRTYVYMYTVVEGSLWDGNGTVGCIVSLQHSPTSPCVSSQYGLHCCHSACTWQLSARHAHTRPCTSMPIHIIHTVMWSGYEYTEKATPPPHQCRQSLVRQRWFRHVVARCTLSWGLPDHSHVVG